MERIDNGCQVSLYFTMSLADGTRVDGTEAGQPWSLIVGSGEWPAGFDDCLMGLAVGERGQFVIAAADGFGERDDQSREWLPRAQFPEDVDLIPGMAFGFTLPDGAEVMGQVVTLTAEQVEVDFTHPLAGHDLVLDVEIVAIERPGLFER